ncbi:MAX gene-associated protein isoform X6 [Dermochelys coriacea]|uniref:MAX gene-associated protein isoform X6 n=1 Tax=Dermochelys coriacea TaxID=27794 RepID=UPI0018E7052C|nr:MAX gene-associated protein isoform X6 [Dermochelys coriacea]XP_043373562.1 MAX gene-associated protein isoform X6 [Dermochelys coriacea]
MEKQQIVLGNRDSGTVSGAAPAFFVILKQQQGNGKADQGILVANRDACTLTSSVPTPVKSKVKTCLPADCTSGSITVTLDNNSMWNEFYHRSTEMILTKQGRRMFPYCRYWITGLDSNLKYILVMDISPVDNHRYKWNGRWWEPSGKAEPHVLGRVFIHPESPSTGQYWMHQPVSFYKLKLTNNTLDQEGHIILHSMHRYLPRLHLVPADKATEVIQLNGPDVHTFTFPQTEFFAVTAYQNIQITQLKIDYNPFAKGFRDDGLNSRPQRDLKQNSSSEHEGGSVSSSPSNRGRHTETDGLESQQRDLDSSFSGQNPSDIDLEKESFNAERDFLDFLDADLPLSDMPRLKQEVSESPIASSYESSSRVASPLDPNGHFNVVIKEEPVDDYDYGSSVCIEGITVKQEDTDEETDEYSNSDNDPILEKQLRKRSEMDRKDAGIRSTKRMLANPSGVAKAKMLKLDSGKMPVVYLEPCAVTKSTVKISELPQTMLSSCKKDKSPVSAILDSLPICFENHKDSCLHTVMETEEVAVKKQYSGNKVPQKYCSIKEAPWAISKSSSFKLGSSTGGLFSAKDVAGRKKAGVLRNPMSQKGTGTNQNPMSSGPCRRGRPRKLKISKAGRPPKNIGKNAVTSKNASLGSGSILPDVKPDLEDVDGVLFVSFASKEALDIHTVDRVGGEESQNLQTSLLATSDPGCRARICLLEKELLEDLKSLRHKQVIHPSLQEVGLKLNSVDPTMSIDLKYLGVQLPLSYSKNYSLWNYPRINPGCSDAGFPFVSRTGKTNDFTKIKGWRGKFHGASRNEGSGSEGSLKNRSAFCSDKLDEYLENEGKLMETSMGFSSSTSTSPVVYQLPTKSTSYVRTLDSVLKKQSTSTPSTSYTFKPLAVSSASRKMKTQNKQTASKSRVKPSYKPILPSPVVLKQKHNFSVPGEKVTKSLPSSNMANQVDNFMVPALDENMLPKQISLRQAHQQQQATRPPGLSKSQVKLMDLEDCALWDGKPRTYITEERADISLATLLTAQASLKNKPIHKIIRRRAPPCNNDFCRLGCVCASLALEKRQPTHCRRPDCMFGCTCLKRRVLVVKGGSKHKKILKKAVRGSLVFYGPQGEEQQEEEELEEEGDGEEDELKQKDRRRRKKVEYTICDTEPEQPIRNCPLWIKVEGEIDPEPIYIPTPSVIEPMKPLVLPTPELLPSSKNKSSNGVKPGRVYTPKPNPVIRDEDKDPVYLYFERMMTCARVRAYECKREEKKQQKDLYICNSNNCIGKEHDPEHQTLKKELCEMEKDTDKSGAARPSPGGVFTQFVMSKVGALQQKIPGVSTPQPLTGPQKFNVRPTPVMVVTPVVPSRPSPVYCTVSPPVTAATTTSPVTLESVTTVASSIVTTTGHTRANESTHSLPGIAISGAPGTSETSACTTVSPTTPTATVNITKATGMTTPVATISFPKSVVTTPTINHPVLTTSSSPVVVTTTAVTSMVTTPTSSVGSVPIILSGINTSPSLNPRPEDGSSQTTTASPQGLSSGTEKRVGPRLLLIPVHQGSPALRPLHNVQLAQGHRMILQPLRSPGGVNLFRHPNGQIIQLVPLHQLRAGGTPSNIQPVMFRNPGSVVGIRLPGPSKPPETPVSPTSSSISIPSVSPVKNSAVQTVGSKSAPTANLVTQASSILPSVPSFVSQAGTLTLRISPPGASSIAGQTGSESKITCSSGGQPTNAASLIPLQSGSFALLQLPGQKSVPNSILHHVASLQIKKDSQNVSQKDESSPTKQQEPEKASHSEDVEVMESEVTVSDSKQEENELPANQSNSTDESAADVIISDRNSTVSEMAEKDPEMLEDYSDDIPTFQHDVSADVISSDHSYISEKPIGEKNKVITEKKRDSVHSEEVLEEVSDNSETISELLGQAVVAPENTVYPESPREQEETAMLKSHVEEYTTTVQAESPDTEQEGNAEPQKKGEEKGNGAQSQSPQEKQEIYAQLESKDKQQEGIQPLQNQKELQDSSAQPEVKRKECEDSVETENIMEERENKSEIIYTKEHDNNSGEMPVESTDECKRNLDIQEKLNSPNQEQGTTGFQKASENAKDNSIHVNSSWNTISSKATDSDNKSNTERENKVEKSVKGYFLTPEQRSQEPKRHKKGYTPTVDITTDDVEEEEEEDDDEKTDDSADEMLDGASDFQSEEEVDVEKLPRVSHSSVPDGLYLLSEDTIGGSALLNDCEYSENDEPVDIETVEELSEKINIARLKATASSIGSSKQKHRIHNPSDEKVADKSTKKPQFWNRKQKNEAEAFAHYRQTHTANERRRRNEMRDLFEKLKRALGLHSLPKVSKCYILKQAYEEIQGLTDQADKLIGQKNLLTRKQDILIRKVSTLSGKTEEVVLKKLEYIYAKQKAVEAQKKRKQVEPEELVVSTKPSRQQEESSTSSKELEQMIVTNRRGKPLILARKGGQAAVETTSSPITLTTAGLVMTPQGQMLTLKSPLMPGQVATVPSTLLQAELKPQVASNTVTTQPGIASVMIQLPGSTVPVQVKGILTNSAIPITLSTIASNPVPPAVGTAAEPASESEDSFMMPKIVNVTSLAAEGGVNLNLNRNKNSHVTPGAGAQTSEPSLKAGPHESRRNEDILSEDKNKASPGDSCGDGRSATGPTQIFLENKDSSFPQIRNVPSVKDSSESFAKKSCIGEFLGSQGRRKETDQGGERLKPKDSPFRKLQVKDLKDSRIEMELRKVASAIEEAELDPSELLGSIEENDDTDETLTSLLNEIAFLNQQLNDDTSGMSELPSTLSSDFSPEDSETRRGTASELTTAAGASFQFGHLGSSFKGLSEVRESSGSISPLLLHLEDDDLTDGERNSAEPSSQADILKIVIGSEMKDPLANLSVTGGGSGKTLDPLAEINVSPPILQMKTNLEAGNTDTRWRPMPKLAPLGLKVANLPLDSEGQSTKVMPVLAPVVAKLAPVGLKTKLPASDLEGQDSKIMPTLASVVTKLNSIGTLPSNSAGK